MASEYVAGTTMYSRDGQVKGELTGATHPCTLTGCWGVRISVRWENGRHTYPCSAGVRTRPDGALQIIGRIGEYLG